MPSVPPFGSSQIYSKINFPAFNILDALASVARERSWDLTQATGEILGTTVGASTPTKPFIVGFIPPDVVVNFVPITKNQSTLTTLAGTATPAGPTTKSPPPKGFGTASQHSAAFYQKLQSVAAACGASPADMLAIMLSESGVNAGATNYFLKSDGTRDMSQLQGVGLIGFTTVVANHFGTTLDAISQMSDVQQLSLVQQYYQTVNQGGTYPNSGALYVANFACSNLPYVNDPNHVIFSQAKDGQNYAQNTGLDVGNKGYITIGDMTTRADSVKSTPAYQQLLSAFNAATNNMYQYPNPTIPDPTANSPSTTSIMTNANVTEADIQDPLSNQLGRNISVDDTRAIAVQKQTNYLNQQIALIQSIPALMMLVNPSEFTRNYEHTTDPVKTRSGYVVNMWLEKPVTISSRGVTAAQYAFRADGSGGLVSFNRIQSASYQNLMSLVSIFKNNGNIFTDTSFGDSNQGVPLISMSLYIYYDNHLYIGSFDEFSVTDDGNKPYNLAYNWKFTVRYDVDTSSVSDSAISYNLGLPANTSAAFTNSTGGAASNFGPGNLGPGF